MAKEERNFVTVENNYGIRRKFFLSECSKYGAGSVVTYAGTEIGELILPYIKPEEGSQVTWRVLPAIVGPTKPGKLEWRFTYRVHGGDNDSVLFENVIDGAVKGNAAMHVYPAGGSYGKIVYFVAPNYSKLIRGLTNDIAITVPGLPIGEQFDGVQFSDASGDKTQWIGRGVPPSKFPGNDNEDDPEGGDGDGPDAVEDDPIEFPEKPGITVTDAGLMTLYTPTQGQIHAFGDFLWSDAFSLDTFKKLFADPMQAVIGLSIVPVDVPTAGAQPITIGAISSGVTANRAASQYVVHDCGTLNVNPVWNTSLDFSPYTKFSIYLPFIGTRELKTDDIMGKELNVKYFVDVLSGACTAHISVGGSVLYQFSGSCATPVPLSAMNWNSTLTSMIQLAGAGIAMAVTGGAAAPAAAGMLTTATGMIGNKPNVQRSGAVSGAAGMLGVKTPYLIRETPRQSLAKDYAHYSGYPSNITAVLGTLKGFTMVENMHLKNIDATADELDEIETALKEGVIL